MGKIEDEIRSAITRVIRRELNSRVVPLARDVRELKRTVSSLARSVASLGRMAAAQARQEQAKRARLEAPEEEVKVARMSAALIRKLRTRLKLTQNEVATVLGVSPGSVTAWEAGRSAPRGANRAALVALRKLGRRDVRKILTDKGAAAPAENPSRKSRRRRPARRRK